MKILLVTGIFPPDIGGPATYVPQIAEALVDKGYDVRVLTLADSLDNQVAKNYTFEVVRFPRQEVKVLRWVRTVLGIIRLGRTVDVLFINGLAMEAALANLVLRKPLVQKVVGDFAWERATNRGWTTHSFEDFQKQRCGAKVRILKALRNWWTSRATRVIVPSEYLARWVVSWGIPEGRLAVIHNSVASHVGVQPVDAPLDFRLIIVTVGRLVKWKHIDGILKALTSLKDIGLVVIGDGPERRHLEALAKDLGVIRRVHFAGQLTRLETLTLLSACDVFVLNSSYEGFPHVVVEAMQAGLAVVATSVGGTPEIVHDEETGLLVPPNDVSALHQALSRLFNDERLLRSLAQRGQRAALEDFSSESTAERTEAVLRQVVSVH